MESSRMLEIAASVAEPGQWRWLVRLTGRSRFCNVGHTSRLLEQQYQQSPGGGMVAMAFWLLEVEAGGADQAALRGRLDTLADLAKQAGGELIEAQVDANREKAFIVLEHEDRARLATALDDSGFPAASLSEVRLVGASIEDVKAARGTAQFLVEWDFPAGLEMDTYLARKKEKAPLYANVPEVRFLRTWVREDMVKCLCFYEAPDEAAVVRAREAVSTPIDRLTKLAVSEHVGG
jgi:hypothetical protein